ncbi:alcohol dehydrogenase catalytic domain-containing protein [Aneurinibacillus tyrosinisolvens]|uniref:alcohol dehydrogenase catalytic domain-containing protein n=1 Tax=Aneurinibacillus tyrosinisolvens TaxID=1443435 RepID=UPI00063EEF54|nr:alcohol dehydrogenase catalytic domain-containing protein [Aneurinibacillus tyrosinisolvens]
MSNRGQMKCRFVYGSDGAGVIEAVGEHVQEWHKDDEVIINAQISCGQCQYCLTGDHALCEKGQILGGKSLPGTLAEFVKVPARNLTRKPQHLTFHEAAAKGGRVIQFAYTGQSIPAFDVDMLMFKQLSLIGTGMNSDSEFVDAIRFFNEHKIVPIVSEIIPLEQVQQGFERMKNSSQFGKIVLSIEE